MKDLEAGLVIGSEPDRYTPKGGRLTADKQREEKSSKK
jgi:hypothetical protein